MRRRTAVVLGAMAVAVTGTACGSALRLGLVEAAHRQPSNVAVYFTVDTRGGEPVPGLEAEDFRIYEDGTLVSVRESQQTIVNPEVAAEHYTLLLVDMSGSVSESDQVPLIEEAAQQFTSQLESHQRVAVYAFDGSEDIRRITAFTGSEGSVNAGVGRLSSYTPRDPSTNLHGAVVAAIHELDDAMERSRTPLHFGTVVVFTDGTDRAHRVSAREMAEAIDGSDYDFFAIGVGEEIDEGTLGAVGREGYVMVDDSSALAEAFQRISERIVGMTQRYYLLSYCSPARAGTHTVTVEAVSEEHGSGSLTHEFDAEGFGPRCDPSRPPPFETRDPTRSNRRRSRAGRGQRLEVRARAGGGGAAVTAESSGDPEAGDD